jgi:hypothetical protein
MHNCDGRLANSHHDGSTCVVHVYTHNAVPEWEREILVDQGVADVTVGVTAGGGYLCIAKDNWRVIGYCHSHNPHPTEQAARDCYRQYLTEVSVWERRDAAEHVDDDPQGTAESLHTDPGEGPHGVDPDGDGSVQ